MISAPAGAAAPPRRQLYGRRRGRRLRPGQRALVERLLPQLRFALPAGAEHLDPRQLFAAAPAEVWLEIGYGSGEHLAFQARAHPEIGHIGCEVFEPGIARLLAEIDDRRLANLRLFADDARLLLGALAPRSLGRVFILFPDPWPKERHKKRRIVAEETLDGLAAAMRDDAELRLATDDRDYAQWIAERLAAHRAFARLDLTARPADWPPTRFEKKALRQGRAAQLFLYRRRPR